MNAEQEINNIMSDEMVQNHFDAFLKRNFTGNQIEAMDKNGTLGYFRWLFEYAFLKGAEESLAVFRVIIKEAQEKGN